MKFCVRQLRQAENRYAPCLSSILQFEFCYEKQKEFFQRTYFNDIFSTLRIFGFESFLTNISSS
jgi:hypothetical protein